MYWDDKYGTQTVSSDIISTMRVMMTEDSNNLPVSTSFLLDDDSSIPFSVDDISKSMQHIEVGEIEPPPQPSLLWLRRCLNPYFQNSIMDVLHPLLVSPMCSRLTILS
ncbi:hypothetical protein ACFE04_022737 [Oxalis oulophora]